MLLIVRTQHRFVLNYSLSRYIKYLRQIVIYIYTIQLASVGVTQARPNNIHTKISLKFNISVFSINTSQQVESGWKFKIQLLSAQTELWIQVCAASALY